MKKAYILLFITILLSCEKENILFEKNNYMSLPNEDISTDLVKQTIGVESNDVGTLCSHDNVNIYSDCRPGYWGVLDGVLKYYRPDGLREDPRRNEKLGYSLDDFRGYKHAARPFSVQYPLKIPKICKSTEWDIHIRVDYGLTDFYGISGFPPSRNVIPQNNGIGICNHARQMLTFLTYSQGQKWTPDNNGRYMEFNVKLKSELLPNPSTTIKPCLGFNDAFVAEFPLPSKSVFRGEGADNSCITFDFSNVFEELREILESYNKLQPGEMVTDAYFHFDEMPFGSTNPLTLETSRGKRYEIYLVKSTNVVPFHGDQGMPVPEYSIVMEGSCESKSFSNPIQNVDGYVVYYRQNNNMVFLNDQFTVNFYHFDTTYLFSVSDIYVLEEQAIEIEEIF